MDNDLRIDKYLWCIRAFKTRTLAADACRLNRVKINEQVAKASRDIKVGDIIEIRKEGFNKTYRVLAPLGSRVSADKVPVFAEDLTPDEEIEKARTIRQTNFERRDSGLGRPTKRDRRDIERLKEYLK